MSLNQSVTDKIKIAGWADSGKKHAMLQATCHRAEETLAKAILQTLYTAFPTHWDVEFQNDSIAFWCGLHPTYGYRLRYADLNKGLSIIRRKGLELVERIQAGACH